MDGYDISDIVAANSAPTTVPEERVQAARERYLRARYWDHVRPHLAREEHGRFQADDIYDAMRPHTPEEVDTALVFGAWEDPYLNAVADGYVFLDEG